MRLWLVALAHLLVPPLPSFAVTWDRFLLLSLNSPSSLLPACHSLPASSSRDQTLPSLFPRASPSHPIPTVMMVPHPEGDGGQGSPSPHVKAARPPMKWEEPAPLGLPQPQRACWRCVLLLGDPEHLPPFFGPQVPHLKNGSSTRSGTVCMSLQERDPKGGSYVLLICVPTSGPGLGRASLRV